MPHGVLRVGRAAHGVLLVGHVMPGKWVRENESWRATTGPVWRCRLGPRLPTVLASSDSVRF
eukprot:115393-Prorocentrum_minimum.AAC.1